MNDKDLQAMRSQQGSREICSINFIVYENKLPHGDAIRVG